MRTRTSPAGEAGPLDRQAGFTLLELLAVFAIVALVLGAMVVLPTSGSGSAAVRSIAVETASRLRQVRAAAINSGRAQSVLVDLRRRIIATGGGRRPLRVAKGIRIRATAAASEQRSGAVSGIRFFPNGSATGGTLRFAKGRQAFEVRVNWLTGRVSVQHAP